LRLIRVIQGLGVKKISILKAPIKWDRHLNNKLEKIWDAIVEMAMGLDGNVNLHELNWELGHTEKMEKKGQKIVGGVHLSELGMSYLVNYLGKIRQPPGAQYGNFVKGIEEKKVEFLGTEKKVEFLGTEKRVEVKRVEKRRVEKNGLMPKRSNFKRVEIRGTENKGKVSLIPDRANRQNWVWDENRVRHENWVRNQEKWETERETARETARYRREHYPVSEQKLRLGYDCDLNMGEELGKRGNNIFVI